MAMKQTQTKLFDFSDAGLDFCAGSKALFPDRFNKMLALGYNVQTVTNVAIVGDQVTLTYGGAHGYVADRVLKVDSGDLSLINNGEFWIDSVTINTVTFTLDDAPTSVAGGFTTRIAPLGWDLVYEVGNIHVYKLKALDDSDLYLRLCFQNNAAYRNSIAPCIGKSFDDDTGAITDEYALAETKNLTTPHAGFKWEFSGAANATSNSYSYSQGYSAFGKAVIIGSKYHFISMHNINANTGFGRTIGFAPTFCHNYPELDYPVMIGESFANPQSSNTWYQLSNGRAYLGNIRVQFEVKANNPNTLFALPQANNSFLANIEPFNVTSASPIAIYDHSTLQHYGYISGGLYICKYASTNAPAITFQSSPFMDIDVDYSSTCYVHYAAENATANYAAYFAVVIEEVKYA